LPIKAANTPARSLTPALWLAALVLALLSLLSLPSADAEARRSQAALDPAERALVSAINRTRRAHGLHRLHRNRGLQKSADYHCWDMLQANFFAHASSNGTPFKTRVGRYTRLRRIGENLAYVPSQDAAGAADQVVEMWMQSSVHRESLLSPTFTRVGIARRIGTWGDFRVAVYTADFAAKR
jgi:uncharacterized protein YkwD